MIEPDGGARLRREGKQWETVPIQTVRSIRHADALAVWVSLITRPDDWIVRRRQLRDELGIGEIRLRKAIDRLVELGLWQVRTRRDSDGRLAGREVVIRYEASPNAEDPRDSVILEVRKTRRLTQDREITQNKSTTHTPARTRGAAPAGAPGGVGREAPAAPDGAGVDLRGLADAQRRAIAKAWRSLAPEAREACRAILANKLAEGRVRDPVAYARALARRAQAGELAEPPELAEARRAREIEARAAEITEAVEAGADLLLDGRPAELDAGFILAAGGAISLVRAVAAGRVEVAARAA